MDGSTATLDEVEAWLRARLGSRARPKIIVDRPMRGDEQIIRARLWTTTNVYSIVAKPKLIVAKACPPAAEAAGWSSPYPFVPPPEDRVLKGYLGCIASQRAPRPGETHTRGNDLTDGELNDETMTEILADIVHYESLEIPKAARAVEVVVDQPDKRSL